MKYKPGDKVWAVTPDRRTHQVTIRAVHEDDPEFPYEIESESRNRFYSEDMLADTQDEATAKAVSEALSQDQYHIKHNAHWDPKTKTFLSDRGVRISKYWDISPEDQERVNNAARELMAVCNSLDIPMMCLGLVSNTEDTGKKLLACNLPGPRLTEELYVLSRLATIWAYGGEPPEDVEVG